MGTYTLGDVVNAVSATIPRVSEEKYVDLIANGTQASIWNRFDWRETIGKVPPFWCVPDQQDYGAPAVIIPDDFLGIRKGYQISILNYPQVPAILQPIREIDITGSRAIADAVSYNKDTQTFRISRLPLGSMCAPNWLIALTYKRKPTKITKANYATFPLFSEDQYFDVWVSVMKAVATEYVPNIPNKDALLQAATIALLKMASNEGFNLGETPVAPSEALASRNWGQGGGAGVWLN